MIGAADTYRGESVKAFVSLKSGAAVTPEELIERCRPQMATYKRPQAVEIVADLAKAVTGKSLRRLLRYADSRSERRQVSTPSWQKYAAQTRRKP